MAAESAASRRLRLTLAYDGAAFWGAQVQPGRRTIGGDLEGALARLTGTAPRVTFAGRTDRGVHAAGQVAHCDVVSRLDDRRLLQALNAVLAEEIAILQLTTAPDDFHARYSARWREYRYAIWNAPVRHPALARTTWWQARPLDLAALEAGAAELVGEHDFAAFAGQGLGGPTPPDNRSTRRMVHRVDWRARDVMLPVSCGEIVELTIRANGFLPQMVRTICGALALVGSGEREPDWVRRVLQGRQRAALPAPAPPQGLTLWRVGYTGDEGD